MIAAIGAGIGWNINNDRFGKYEPYFGPMDYQGKVTAVNAVADMRKDWQEKLPKVELPDGNTFDFGIMSLSDEGEHVFVIKNTGEADLSLKVGASTCKCTVGELGKETLPPGEQTQVKMSWTVSTNENSFGQSAELRTNDPSQVAIRFEITGKVVRQMQLVPEQVTLGETAAGEEIDFEVRIFNYLENDVVPGEVKFSDEEVNGLSEITVEPFEPSAEDDVNAGARQGFLLRAKIQPGLKQGPISQNISMPFLLADSGEAGTTVSSDKSDGENVNRYISIPVTGRIVGALSMLPNSMLRGVSGGGYIFDFGKRDADADLTAKLFVALKGQEKESTKLSIGEVFPADAVDATLADPIGRGQMNLYALQLKLKPGQESFERLGLSQDDYGYVMIESDNPKVPPLKLRLKFSVSAR